MARSGIVRAARVAAFAAAVALWACAGVGGWRAPLFAPALAVEGPSKDAAGILIFTVSSPYQRHRVPLQVLLPEPLEPGRRYPALYILPVFAGATPKASGIFEARRLNLANKYGLICVAPAFDACPWYADRPDNPGMRQESHLLKAVIPFVERTFPVIPSPPGRLLVGFSKSGWGAFTLLLRYPRFFGRAAAWDAPMTLAAPDRWEMEPNMGSQKNFKRYRVMGLLERRAGMLAGGPPRLALLGYGLFRDEVEAAHRKMSGLGIPHIYDNSVRREHNWTSGWLETAVRALVLPPEPGRAK